MVRENQKLNQASSILHRSIVQIKKKKVKEKKIKNIYSKNIKCVLLLLPVLGIEDVGYFTKNYKG